MASGAWKMIGLLKSLKNLKNAVCKIENSNIVCVWLTLNMFLKGG